jgi:hypothetical protein
VERFATTSQVEGLPHPFGNGHAASAGDALNLAVFGILKDDLEPLSRILSLNDS